MLIFLLNVFCCHTGCYFGSHFNMGGQRFETPQPEAYLFGENSELNYLGTRPSPVSLNIIRRDYKYTAHKLVRLYMLQRDAMFNVK